MSVGHSAFCRAEIASGGLPGQSPLTIWWWKAVRASLSPVCRWGIEVQGSRGRVGSRTGAADFSPCLVRCLPGGATGCFLFIFFLLMFNKLHMLKVYNLLSLTYVYNLETNISVQITTTMTLQTSPYAPAFSPSTSPGGCAFCHWGFWNFIYMETLLLFFSWLLSISIIILRFVHIT